MHQVPYDRGARDTAGGGLDIALERFASSTGDLEAGRLPIWRDTWRMIVANPLLGTGFGTYESVNAAWRLAPDGFANNHAHSEYLEVAAETGLLGLVAFLGAVTLTLVQLATARRACRLRAGQEELGELCAACFLALVAYLGTGLFLHLAYMRYFWLLLALGGAAGGWLQRGLFRLVDLTASILDLLLIPFFVFYFLADYEAMRRRVDLLIPPRFRSVTADLLGQINHVVSSYVRSQLVIALAMGGLYSVGFLALRVPLALTIGMLSGLLNFVPYLGTLLGIVFSLAFAALDGAGLVLALVTVFKHTWSPVTAPMYAVAEGLFLGALSAVFEARYPGIVVQAVMLTFGTLFALLMVYRSGLIKVTENFKLGVFAATGGIMLIYLAGFVLSFFSIRIPYIHESGLIGIGFSLFVVVIASLNLVLDFDFIEKAAEQGVPKYMEWYAGFGLIVTLIWLYIEFLRLLSKLRDR